MGLTCAYEGPHCTACRLDLGWRLRARAAFGAGAFPDDCPNGITETNLPGVEVSRKPVVAYVKGCVGCREKARAKLVR